MGFHYFSGFFCCLLLISVQGWWQTGHMLVAEIAKQELLSSHPDIYHRAEEIALFVKGLTHNLSDTFVESAVWLDDVKEDAWDSFFTWHFVNKPFNPLGIQTLRNNPYSALYAINQATKVISNNRTTGEITISKSIFMRILLHVVGDIHQPLHCVELYNLTYPLGDEGGNLVEVTVEALNQKMPLHSYWDAIAFQFENNFRRPLDKSEMDRLENLAKKITDEFPKSHFAKQLKLTDLNQWTIDSYLEAIEHAYKPLKEDLIIDKAYETQAFHIMKRNIALGGYRLANLIHESLLNEVLTIKIAQLRPYKLRVRSD